MKKNIKIALMSSAAIASTAIIVIPTATVLTLDKNKNSTNTSVNNVPGSNNPPIANANNVLSLSPVGQNMSAGDFGQLLSLCQEYGTSSGSNPFTKSLYSYFEINNQPLNPNFAISAKLVNKTTLDVNVTNPATGFTKDFTIQLSSKQTSTSTTTNTQNTTLNISATNPLKLFAFGDSITAGFNPEFGFSNPGYYDTTTKSLAGISYPAFLAQDVQRINPAYLASYQNYALSGSTVENWMYILGQAIAKQNNTTNPYTQYFSSTVSNFNFDNQISSAPYNNPENGRISKNFGTNYNSADATYSNVYNQIKDSNMITFSLGANDLLDSNFFMNLVGLILSFSTSSFSQNYKTFEASFSKIQADITSHLQIVLQQLREINPTAMITAISYPSPLLRLNEAVSQVIAENSNNAVVNFATQTLDQLDSSIQNAISDFNKSNSSIKPINYVNIFNRSYWQDNSSKLSQGLFDIHPTTYGYKKMSQALLLKLIIPSFSSYQTIQNLFPDWSEDYYNDNIINEGITFGDGTTTIPLDKLINDIEYVNVNGTKTLNVYTDGPLIQNYSKYKLGSFGQYLQSYIENSYPSLGVDLSNKLVEWIDSKTTDVTVQNAFKELLSGPNMQTSINALFKSNFIENFINSLQKYFANNNNITKSDLVNGLLNSLNINSILDVVKIFLENPAFSTPANLANIRIVMNYILSITLNSPSLNQKISSFVASFLSSKMVGSGISQNQIEALISSFLSSPYTNQLITNIVVNCFENGQALAKTQTFQQFIELVLQENVTPANLLDVVKIIFTNQFLSNPQNGLELNSLITFAFKFINGNPQLVSTLSDYLSSYLITQFKLSPITEPELGAIIGGLLSNTEAQLLFRNVIVQTFSQSKQIAAMTTLNQFLELVLKSNTSQANILILLKAIFSNSALIGTANAANTQALLKTVFNFINNDVALQSTIISYISNLLETNFLDQSASWKAAKITPDALNGYLKDLVTSSSLQNVIINMVETVFADPNTITDALNQTTIIGFVETILKSGFNSTNILSLFKALLADPTLNTKANNTIFTNIVDGIVGDFSTNSALRLKVSNSLGALLADTFKSKIITAADLSSILNAALGNKDLVPLINQVIDVALSNTDALQKATTLASFLDTITSKLIFQVTNQNTGVTTQTPLANNIQSLIDAVLSSDGFANMITSALSMQNTTATQNGYVSTFFVDLFNQYWTSSAFQQTAIFTYVQDNIFSIIMSGDFSSIITEIQTSLSSAPLSASGIISALFTPLTQVSGQVFGNFINLLFTNTPQNEGIYKFFKNLPTMLKSLPRSQMQEAYTFGALDSVFQGIATIVQNQYEASLDYSKTNPTVTQNNNPYYQSAKRTLITALIIIRFISGQTNFTNTSSGSGWFSGTNYLAYLISLFPTNSNGVVSPIVNDILGTSTGILTGSGAITTASPIIQNIYNIFSNDNSTTNPTTENENAMNSIIAFLN